MRILVIAAAVLTTAACGELRPTDSELTSRDWAKPGVKRQDPQPQVWCYRTIGRPECSSTPLPGQEHRLIEGGPQPAQPTVLVDAEGKPIEKPSGRTKVRDFLGL